MKQRIYLDNNATTRVDPRVAQAISEELCSPPSNPSSVHNFGQEAKQRLKQARDLIARYLDVKPHEVIFTSGGTESMNLLIRGCINARKFSESSQPLSANCSTGHILTSDVEHACVYNTLKEFEQQGFSIQFLPAGLWGAVQVDAIAQAIQPHTTAIILSAANSETGVKHDLEAIGALALQKKIPLIVDGVALLGKEPCVIPNGVSAMGFSGHKLHAPKGIGLSFIRSDFAIAPLLSGGDQEYGRRSGTENLPGIIGLAKAIELLETELLPASERMRNLRDYLESKLLFHLDPVIINGKGPRVANTSNLSFPGVQGEDLLMALDLCGIAVSHGSACSSGALEPSRILTNMGVSFQTAKSAIRFSLSRDTTQEEIDQCIETVVQIVRKLRNH